MLSNQMSLQGETTMKRPFPNLAVFSVLSLGLLAGSKTWANDPSNIGVKKRCNG